MSSAPTTPPPQVRIVYAECNTGPTGPSGGSFVPWDTFYDLAQDEVTSLLLAPLGLTYAAGVFTATARVVLAVNLGASVAAAPGGACEIILNHPGFDFNPTVQVPNPNTLGDVTLCKTFAMVAGERFSFGQVCTNASDTPLTYAAMSIVRLV